jgi:hypothetical protein
MLIALIYLASLSWLWTYTRSYHPVVDQDFERSQIAKSIALGSLVRSNIW